ncbi:hypothetical protein MAPG_05662 [Magnaporthiopsis poae ATCC 64411]|uniref:Uncharacterized protein n=1 Tax=Magnaporthiopsis poae (strain ATCC 64411 / 73-15) TaxID=644358 RepID=A0A0C4DZZ9_MAGP6|nr:hypothetical protein MAPG_05662 [Magnaporthiopsis poae ATCC 64411]
MIPPRIRTSSYRSLPLEAKRYLRDHAGIDADYLLLQRPEPLSSPIPRVAVTSPLDRGELGFFAPYLSCDGEGLRFSGPATSRSTGEKRATLSLDVPGTSSQVRGEFRFDRHYAAPRQQVDKLAAIIAADTITKPPGSVWLLLGLVTRSEDGGVSERVGIGYVYCPKKRREEAEAVPMPRWKYKFFRLG